MCIRDRDLVTYDQSIIEKLQSVENEIQEKTDKIAKDKKELDTVISNLAEDKKDLDVYKRQGGRGADIVVESGGTPITSAQVLGLGCKGAKVLYLGIPYGDVNIPREYFEKIGRSELTVFGSWNAIQQGFPGKPWTTAIATVSYTHLDVYKRQCIYS